MKKARHFKEDVIPNKDNYSSVNPINKNSIRRKKINGHYVYERFYLIDFYDIRENSYVISSFGRIFSLIKNIEMKPFTMKNGYESIILSTNSGESKKFLISCLVARAFIPKSESDKRLRRMFVHHKNWDVSYNYYWNLEWRSKTEINLMVNLIGKDAEDEYVVKVVCRLLEVKTSIADIFEIIGRRLSKDKISKIRRRITHTSISKKYDF